MEFTPKGLFADVVSTHSRPKAAGAAGYRAAARRGGFNTQPPEGGWGRCTARRRAPHQVSTHSRPKAAGDEADIVSFGEAVSTHSRPKAAGNEHAAAALGDSVSTHSRPKAAGFCRYSAGFSNRCFNTQPPEGGWAETREDPAAFIVSTHSRPKAAGKSRRQNAGRVKFQHTAARRRLVLLNVYYRPDMAVSTHSRPKAAGSV